MSPTFATHKRERGGRWPGCAAPCSVSSAATVPSARAVLAFVASGSVSCSEPSWFWWRLWPLLSGEGLVALPGSVEAGLELGGRDVAEVAVQALSVVPVHPAERGELDVFDGLPGAAAGGAADQ